LDLLQDDLLMEARDQAVQLQLEKEFIKLLEEEISKRRKKLPDR
jgi:hypothetical protein